MIVGNGAHTLATERAAVGFVRPIVNTTETEGMCTFNSCRLSCDEIFEAYATMESGGSGGSSCGRGRRHQRRTYIWHFCHCRPMTSLLQRSSSSFDFMPSSPFPSSSTVWVKKMVISGDGELTVIGSLFTPPVPVVSTVWIGLRGWRDDCP